jgi:hypothetical protein
MLKISEAESSREIYQKLDPKTKNGFFANETQFLGTIFATRRNGVLPGATFPEDRGRCIFAPVEELPRA